MHREPRDESRGLTGVAHLSAAERGKATFSGDADLVIEREVEVRVTEQTGSPRRVSGRLLGGRDAAVALSGRRLTCVVPSIGAEPLPCVVHVDGQIHFLPVGPPNAPPSAREPRRPQPDSDHDRAQVSHADDSI